MSDLLQAALAYAARGWRVFPCHTPTQRGCSCRQSCGRTGKHPRTQHGLKDATTDEATIRRWWQQWPQANIAIATGVGSGVVVLDEDSYKGGDTSRVELEHTYSPLPETVQQLTGGGGVQYFFAHPGASVKNGVETLGTGLDIRGDGGYIIAPPSLHASGKRYTWEVSHHPDEMALAPMPPWLLALCQDTACREAPSADEPIPQGHRNQTLFQLGCAMRTRGFSEAAIAGALTAINETQCQPPLDDAEVATIAASCVKYAAGHAREGAHHQQDAPGDDTLSASNTFIASTPWPEIDDHALYGLAGQIVQTIAPHTEADPIAILLQFLTMFGNLIGRALYSLVEADRHSLNLFVCLVGETSKGRKGVSAGYPKRLLETVDNVWAQRRMMSGLSSGEGLLWYVRDPSYKLGKDGAEECTDEGEQDKRLLVLEPEFARVLRVLAREGNTLSAVIRHAWDDGTLQTMVSGRRVAPVKATGAHISIIGHITVDELRRNLTETETSNGFANRFLWCCVRRARLLPEGGMYPTEALKPFSAQLTTAVIAARKTGRMERDEGARQRWGAIYEELSAGKPGLLGHVTARAEAQVLRLSCLYALFDQSPIVKVAHLDAALALWKYCEASAVYIFGDALGDAVADEILQMLRAVAPEGMTRTDIYNAFGRNKKSTTIQQALAGLRRHQLVTYTTEETGGRPIERWYARLTTPRSTQKTYLTQKGDAAPRNNQGQAPLNAFNTFNAYTQGESGTENLAPYATDGEYDEGLL
jgi:hypothetical protein